MPTSVCATYGMQRAAPSRLLASRVIGQVGTIFTRHGTNTAPPRRERRPRLQPSHRGSVGTHEEPAVTVVHVAAARRLEGQAHRCGIRWRPGDSARHLRTTEMLPGFPAHPVERRAHIAGSGARESEDRLVVLCASLSRRSGATLPTELPSHGYEQGRGRGADGQSFVSAGGIERLGLPGRVHTDLCVACRPLDLRLDVSNQPGSNPAVLEADADVRVPEVAARQPAVPTSVPWLSATNNRPSAVMP